MYQPVTVVTPQGQVVTQALSPGTIRIQNSQVCFMCFCRILFWVQINLTGFKRFGLNLTHCQNELWVHTYSN